MSPEAPYRSQAYDPVEFRPPPEQERTIDAFWDQWGEVSGLSREQFSIMWDTSARRIGNEFGYHNVQHPLESLWVAMQWADFFEAQGLKVNRKVIIGADLYHDDGYHEDHISRGFNSKEEYSAYRFKEDAHLYDFTEAEVELGNSVIITTRRKEVPTSVEGVIMLLGDIWNVGADYDEDFHPKTENFADETRVKQELQDKEFDKLAFLDTSIAVLADYIWALLNQRICNVDKFVRPAIANLRRFAREVAKLEGVTIGEYFKKLNNPVVSNLLRFRLPKEGISDD